jgi:hypothetical protein
MLRSVGFGPRSVSVVVLSEAALLLCAGMAIGIACAAVAVAPAWIERGGGQPGGGLILLLLAVAIAGMVASALATRAALRGRLLDALAAE